MTIAIRPLEGIEQNGNVGDASSGGSGVSLKNGPGAFDACRSLLFAKDRRPHLIGLPIEKIIKARPCIDFGLANLAFETAGMLVRMFLFGRSVIHPATGAVEIFGRPYAVCHPANMRFWRPDSSRYPLPQLMTHYPTAMQTREFS